MAVVEEKDIKDGIGEREGARKATGVFPILARRAEAQARELDAETQVVAKARRRRFSAKYKRRVLREANRCKDPGATGALLRRE